MAIGSIGQSISFCGVGKMVMAATLAGGRHHLG
jgi:hypothetical protein